MSNYRFSGHETFHCKSFWIKKGFDFIANNRDFKSNEALIELGVGKNMVASISHWIKSIGLEDGDGVSDWSMALFNESGFDPYLEDLGTIWLLHFHLLNTNYSSIYKLGFTEFRKSKIGNEFTLTQFSDFLIRYCLRNNISISQTTLSTDAKVFIKNYLRSTKINIKSIEEDTTTLFTEINLIQELEQVYIDNEPVLKFNYNTKESLPPEILLYAIKVKFPASASISILEIQNEVSELFLCNREGTEIKLNQLESLGYLTKKENAGRYEVQVSPELTPIEILRLHYE